MQREECRKICVGADINCFIPYEEVKFSILVPSPIGVPLTEQDFDLGLKPSSNITK